MAAICYLNELERQRDWHHTDPSSICTRETHLLAPAIKSCQDSARAAQAPLCSFGQKPLTYKAWRNVVNLQRQASPTRCSRSLGSWERGPGGLSSMSPWRRRRRHWAPREESRGACDHLAIRGPDSITSRSFRTEVESSAHAREVFKIWRADPQYDLQKESGWATFVRSNQTGYKRL